LDGPALAPGFELYWMLPPAGSVSDVVLSWVLSSWAEGLGFNNLAVLLVGWVGAVIGEDVVLLRSWRLRIELAHITFLCIRIVVEIVLAVVVRSVVRAHHWTVVLEVAFVHVVVLLTIAVAILVIALILWTLVKALVVALVLWSLVKALVIVLVVSLVVVLIVIEVVLVVSLMSHHALIHGLVSVVACLGLVAHLDWVSVRISLHGSLLFSTHNDGYDNTC
jgi:hypothetical protein